VYVRVITTKSTGSNSERTTTKPKPHNRIRNDQQLRTHNQVHKARRARRKATEADKHKHHATDTNIHKQAQCKALIPITDLSGGAPLAMPEAKPAGPHKKADDAVLKASTGLAKGNAEFPEDA
jgi:hypothetical protein